MAETEHEAALLAEQARVLSDLLLAKVPDWVDGVMKVRSGPDAELGQVRDAAAVVIQTARTSTLPAIVRLLDTDIDEQRTSPLDLVRALVPVISVELDQLRAPPIRRDPVSIEMYPEDRYALTPATFADIHPDLHEPGLAWGAAKAHVHLKRHGSQAQPAAPIVVVFAPDLGDRSRFDAFDVYHVRSAGKLAEFAESKEPDLVIVDLDRTSAPADFRIDNAHVVGFGSHVDTDRHDDALDAGFDAVMARSIFFRRLRELLEPVAKAGS